MRHFVPFLLAVISAVPLHAQQTGELSPHFTGKGYQYVGEFFRNYAYIIKKEDGELGGKLADNKFMADVISAREQVVILLRRPKDGQLAIMDPSDPEARKSAPADLKFQAAPVGSMMAKSWERASNPKAHEADRTKGKEQQWLSVGRDAQPRQTERYYVGTEIKTEPKSSFQFTPLLIITEERMTLFLDPANKKFAPVTTDLLGTPLDPIKYRDMTDGGMAEAVWKLLKPALSK